MDPEVRNGERFHWKKGLALGFHPRKPSVGVPQHFCLKTAPFSWKKRRPFSWKLVFLRFFLRKKTRPTHLFGFSLSFGLWLSQVAFRPYSAGHGKTLRTPTRIRAFKEKKQNSCWDFAWVWQEKATSEIGFKKI